MQWILLGVLYVTVIPKHTHSSRQITPRDRIKLFEPTQKCTLSVLNTDRQDASGNKILETDDYSNFHNRFWNCTQKTPRCQYLLDTTSCLTGEELKPSSWTMAERDYSSREERKRQKVQSRECKPSVFCGKSKNFFFQKSTYRWY